MKKLQIIIKLKIMVINFILLIRIKMNQDHFMMIKNQHLSSMNRSFQKIHQQKLSQKNLKLDPKSKKMKSKIPVPMINRKFQNLLLSENTYYIQNNQM